MFVRIARFEGGDAEGIDQELARMREALADRSSLPEALGAVQRVVVLVDRAAGVAVDLTFCRTRAELEAVDAALDAMSPISESSGRRTSVEMFEVGLDAVLA